jgi:hypothetical protein
MFLDQPKNISELIFIGPKLRNISELMFFGSKPMNISQLIFFGQPKNISKLTFLD